MKQVKNKIGRDISKEEQSNFDEQELTIFRKLNQAHETRIKADQKFDNLIYKQATEPKKP